MQKTFPLNSAKNILLLIILILSTLLIESYKITIQGENLLLLSFLCRSNSDNTMHELENIRKSNNIVEYFLTLPKKTFQLEFVTDNNTDFTAKIYSIKIQSI